MNRLERLYRMFELLGLEPRWSTDALKSIELNYSSTDVREEGDYCEEYPSTDRVIFSLTEAGEIVLSGARNV